MGFLFVNTDELSALMGLPYAQQLTYLLGIRPYMDRHTFLVGIKRRISYQSLAEVLYVEPHQGIQNSGSPSRPQLRRIIYGLERAGLIEIQSLNKQLILKCLLANSEIPVQNKPVTNPAHKPDTKALDKNNIKSLSYDKKHQQPNPAQNTKSDTPYNSQNNFIFLRQQFEKFWSLYPLKQDETKTWHEFVRLQPTEALVSHMLHALQAQINNREDMSVVGMWVPNWKYPATWLARQSWNDELLTIKKEELHATNQRHSRKKSATDILTESCKDASFNFNFEQEPETRSNIILFNTTQGL